MVRIEIILPDGRTIPCKIKDKHYKRLMEKVRRLPFWQRVKMLFWSKEKY